MTWRKFAHENDPWQCEFIFGGCHTFAQINAFLVCSFKIEYIIFSLRNLDFYKWCIFNSAQCMCTVPVYTVMILSLWTDTLGQRTSVIKIYTICHSVCIFWSQFSIVKPECPHFSRLMTKPTNWLCTQRRLRSAWASAQSDQSLCCALNG